MPFRPSQKTFQGRDDSQSLNSATFTYDVNTGWTQLVDVVFRVRFTVQEVGNVAGASTYNLYYSLNGGTYTKVTASSAPIQYALSGQYADKAATTKVLDGTGTFVGGQGLETSVDTDSISLAASGNTEVEFCLVIPNAGVADGDTIALRVRRATSTALYSYTNTPSLLVSEPAAPISGALSLTLDDFGVDAVGVVPIVGGFDKTLDVFGLVATGTVQTAGITGEATIQLSPFGLSASGVVPTVGTLSLTMGSFELSASGAVAIVGAASINIDPFALTAAGASAVKGNASLLLDAFGLEASGNVGGALEEIIGSANITLDAFTLIMAGFVVGAFSGTRGFTVRARNANLGFARSRSTNINDLDLRDDTLELDERNEYLTVEG
jgi:hypothetical protein